jgi:hypothetical protein
MQELNEGKNLFLMKLKFSNEMQEFEWRETHFYWNSKISMKCKNLNEGNSLFIEIQNSMKCKELNKGKTTFYEIKKFNEMQRIERRKNNL